MAEIVVIRLPRTTRSCHRQHRRMGDCRWPGARLVASCGSARRSGTKLCLGRKAIVLAPGTDVLLAEPVMPLKGEQIGTMIPFALEEQLASDVDACISPWQTRRTSWRACCGRGATNAWGLGWMHCMRSGIEPDAIYGESAMVPPTPNGVTLLIDDSRVYVRREGTPGAVLDVQPLIEALQLGLSVRRRIA